MPANSAIRHRQCKVAVGLRLPGGERAAIIYTVAETAKLNGLDPEAYIAAVIDRLCRGHTIDRLSELLPWNFKPEKKTVATG
jgi:hypothetical protein